MDDFLLKFYISEGLFNHAMAGIEATILVLAIGLLYTDGHYNVHKSLFARGPLERKKKIYANSVKDYIIIFDLGVLLLIGILSILFSTFGCYLYKNYYLNNLLLEFSKSIILISEYFFILFMALGTLEIFLLPFIKLKTTFRPKTEQVK